VELITDISRVGRRGDQAGSAAAISHLGFRIITGFRITFVRFRGSAARARAIIPITFRRVRSPSTSRASMSRLLIVLPERLTLRTSVSSDAAAGNLHRRDNGHVIVITSRGAVGLETVATSI